MFVMPIQIDLIFSLDCGFDRPRSNLAHNLACFFPLIGNFLSFDKKTGRREVRKRIIHDQQTKRVWRPKHFFVKISFSVGSQFRPMNDSPLAATPEPSSARMEMQDPTHIATSASNISFAVASRLRSSAAEFVPKSMMAAAHSPPTKSKMDVASDCKTPLYPPVPEVMGAVVNNMPRSQSEVIMQDQSTNHARNAIIQLFMCFLSGLFPPDTYKETFPNTAITTSSAFDCVNAPSITPTEYFARIAKFSTCSAETMIRAFTFITKPPDSSHRPPFTARSVHRLLLTAVSFCAKFYDDHHVCLEYYAKIGGIELSELVTLEEIFFRCWGDDLFQPGVVGIDVTWNFLARVAFTVPQFHPQLSASSPQTASASAQTASDSTSHSPQQDPPVVQIEPQSSLLRLARDHLAWGCACSNVSDEIYTFIVEIQSYRNAFVKELIRPLLRTKTADTKEAAKTDIGTVPTTSTGCTSSVQASANYDVKETEQPIPTTPSITKAEILLPRVKPPRARPGGGSTQAFTRRLRHARGSVARRQPFWSPQIDPISPSASAATLIAC
jgi:hypothetical protein